MLSLRCAHRDMKTSVCERESVDAVTQSWCFLGKALSIAIFKAVTPPIKIVKPQLVSLWLVEGRDPEQRGCLQLCLWTFSSVQHVTRSVLSLYF